MNKKQVYSGLGKGVYLVALSRGINRMGDFVEIVLVLILSVRLELSASVVGLISTSVFVLRFIGQLASGWISDRVTRKKLLPTLQLSIVAVYLLTCFFILKNNSKGIIFCILLSSPFRGGTQPVTNAMTADLVKDENRIGDAFSLLYLLTNVGIAIGSIIAGILFNNLILLFSLSALSIGLCALMVILFIPKVAPVKKNKEKERIDIKSLINPTFALLIYFSVFFLLYSFFYNGTTFILPLEAGSYFGEVEGPLVYSSIQSSNAITVIILTPFITLLVSKFNSIWRMVFSMAFFLFGTLCFCFTNAPILLVVSMSIWTIGEILMATNTSVFVNELAPKEKRGFYNSLFLAFGSIGSALAPTILGSIITTSSYKGAWVILSSFVFILVLLLLVLFPLKKKVSSKENQQKI